MHSHENAKTQRFTTIVLWICGLPKFTLCAPATGRQTLREVHSKRTHVFAFIQSTIINLKSSKIYNHIISTNTAGEIL
jgi:hypothetical protein